MSKISKEKQDKIMSNILATLYERSPRALFITEISRVQARDEEFIKDLLISLKKKGLVEEVKKNPKGVPYIKRKRWKLTDQAYLIYRNNQHN